MTDVEAPAEAVSPLQAPLPLCESCGTADVSHAAVIASSGLRNHARPGQDWLRATYGVVPDVLCAACFIPALGNANEAIMRAQMAPGG